MTEPAADPSVHARALAAMGVADDESTGRLSDGIRRSGAGWYPLVALSVLFVVDTFQGTAFGILSPDISRKLGISKAEMASILTLQVMAITLLGLPIAAIVQRK